MKNNTHKKYFATRNFIPVCNSTGKINTQNRAAVVCAALKQWFILAIILACALSPAVAATTTTTVMALSPTSLSMGNVKVGSSSSQWARLTNTGSTSFTLSGVTASNSVFSLSGLSFPLTVSAGQSYAFKIVFRPTAVGVVSGTMSFAYNGTGAPQALSLTGNGLAAGSTLTPSSTSLAFGSVQVGASVSRTLTVTNTGTASAQISQVSIAGSGFKMSALTLPVTLAAGQSVSLTTTFVPAAAGSATGTITIASNASDSTLAIGLSGTGLQSTSLQGTATATPASVTFGTVVTGTSNSQTIKLSNTGTGSLTISQVSVSGAGMRQTGLVVPLTIAAGGSSSFNVVFAPTTAGTVSGSVSVVSNASNGTLAIPVSGTGVLATASLTTNPTSLSFGNVNDGSSSVMDVTLSNTGNVNVTISSVSATGAGFSAAGVSSGLILAPNQSATLQVAFSPATAGVVSGSVAVSSNAANSPGKVALSGTGVLVGAQSVSLTWSASTSTDVTSYNVYRGTTQGVYAKLNSAPVAAMDYVDSTVQSGANTTYYYTVTAVDVNNVESGASNVATALVP